MVVLLFFLVILCCMRHNYPIEQLLRPPVELYAAVVYLFAVVLTLFLPGLFLLPLAMSWPMALIFFYLAVGRIKCGVSVRRYQYQLYQLPPYIIHSKHLPISKDFLFLGLGFPWKSYHTQRRADLERSEWRHVREASKKLTYRLARRFESSIGKLPLFSFLSFITSRKHFLNPVAPVQKPVIEIQGDPSLHGVGLHEGEEDVLLPQSERVAHNIVLGTTRVGKTRLAEVLISQDIHNGDVVIVFDPKGDPDLLARMYHEARAAGRLHQLNVFHLGHPEMSARYNPIGDFTRITEVASRVASQLPGEGNSAAFREFSWRYVNVIAKAINALGYAVSYDSLLQHGSDIDPLLQVLIFVLKSGRPHHPWPWPFRRSCDRPIPLPAELSIRSGRQSLCHLYSVLLV